MVATSLGPGAEVKSKRNYHVEGSDVSGGMVA